MAAAVVAVLVAVAVVAGRGTVSDGADESRVPDVSGRRAPSTRADLAPSATSGKGFLVTVDELRTVAIRAEAGVEPWASAVEDVVREAEEAAERRPSPVAPLRIEGTEGDFVDDSADAYTLALAHALTGQRRFADASARFVRAWATVARTTEDTCTDDGSCNTTLVISRVAPAFVFAADLLTPSGALSDGDLTIFRSWIGDVLLPAASQRTNNWGDAGTFLRITATTYLDDRVGFAAAVATWKEQADLIRPDGEIPEETRRGRDGLQYSQEALLYKVASARIAERHGVELWGYTGAGGGSLEAALDLVAAAIDEPGRWRWHDDVEVPSPAPVWELAAAHWTKPAYEAVAARRRPYGPGGHSAIRWTTLVGGAPSA